MGEVENRMVVDSEWESLEKNIPEEVKEKLVELGKFPSKSDLLAFIERLENNESDLTAFDDAELIMRQEMQQHCPDILITNYSMLEYMLMRPIEKNIWESTISWLNSNPENKLLFIIDEAHKQIGYIFYLSLCYLP